MLVNRLNWLKKGIMLIFKKKKKRDDCTQPVYNLLCFLWAVHKGWDKFNSPSSMSWALRTDRTGIFSPQQM